MNPSRRRLLQVGGCGALVLALGGVGLALQPTRMRTPPGPLEVLDQRAYSVLVAIAEGLLPPRPGLPSPTELDVAFKIDALLARLHPGVGAELSQALMLLENGIPGLLLDGRPRALSTTSVETRTRVLDRWRTSSIPVRRTVFRAVAGLIGATYWGDSRTHEFVGYKGPPAWILAIRDAEPTDGG